MSRYYTMRRPARPLGFNSYPFAQSSQRKSVAAKMDRSQWALSFVGCILALKEYKDNAFYKLNYSGVVVDFAANGKYVKLAPVDRYSGTVSNKSHWHNSSRYYRYSDSIVVFQMELKLAEMQKQVDTAKAEAESVARQQLLTLSQNTVTRALVHAYDNDYCHETAVALISAGHKMPDVTLSFEVTVPVTVTLPGNTSYYPLRTLFGTTRGEVNGARGLDVGNHEIVQDAIRAQFMSGDVSLYNSNVEHTDTDVDWKAPILRQVDAHDAARELTY